MLLLVIDLIEVRRAGNRMAQAICHADAMILHAQRKNGVPQICITQEISELHRRLGREFRVVISSYIASSGYATSCTYQRDGKTVAVLWMIDPIAVNFGERPYTNSIGMAQLYYQGILDTNTTDILLQILSSTGLSATQCFLHWKESWGLKWSRNEITDTHAARTSSDKVMRQKVGEQE